MQRLNVNWLIARQLIASNVCREACCCNERSGDEPVGIEALHAEINELEAEKAAAVATMAAPQLQVAQTKATKYKAVRCGNE